MTASSNLDVAVARRFVMSYNTLNGRVQSRAPRSAHDTATMGCGPSGKGYFPLCAVPFDVIAAIKKY